MKVLLYILTAVFGLGAVFLGFTNSTRHKELIKERDGVIVKNERLSNSIEDKEGEIKEVKGSLEDKKNDIAEAEAEIDTAVQKSKQAQREIARNETRIEEAEENIQQAQLLIDEAMKVVPGSLEISDLPDAIAQIETDKQNMELDLEEKELAANKLGEAVQSKTEELSRLKKQVSDIKRRIKMNSANGSVTSVNMEWGFCVVSLGAKNSNIDQFSEIVVSRGGSFITKLKPKSIEANQTICDIDLLKLKPGVMIQGGDQVILNKVKAQ